MKFRFICQGGQPSCDVLVKHTHLLCLGGEQSKAAISVRLMNIDAFLPGGQETGLQPILEF